MENTKVLSQVRRSRPVTYATAAKLVAQFQRRMQDQQSLSASYTSSFKVSSDIADKLVIVGEELQKLAALTTGAAMIVDAPVAATPAKKEKKEKHKSSSKKRAAEEVLASQDDAVAQEVALDVDADRPLKKKHKKA
jgi:hypothetical protein|eukprot:gene6647-4790_t